ncbi:hypothetical protein RBE51_21610 [Pseudomonas taiwanensis]|uniref:hypothetical protein n=1 Tax=Pseudomonas taiwanensis TaxID=470150 RepID=UPI0028E00C16|nr:hypothetical protein [Pseudomonas taiwanensis]MDT8925397.1 hypothetical protein [Pseudomonas taiwanensis]
MAFKLYIGLMKKMIALPVALLWLLAEVGQQRAFAGPGAETPPAIKCLAVFNQTLPTLRETLRYKLQVSAEPERAIDEYVDMQKLSIVGKLLTAELSGKTSAPVLAQVAIEQLQTPCYEHFAQENFPDAKALRLSRAQIQALDQDIDLSMVDLLPERRQVPIKLAAVLRRELPEHFAEGLSMQRVRQRQGRVDVMFSTSQPVADMYRDAVERNPVQQTICTIALPQLTARAANLVTFTLIAPEDKVLGVFEAKTCQQKESL